jgi:NAD(P)-dependent dehydrogenase (short-subunit alcohol dehydrogenase family)
MSEEFLKNPLSLFDIRGKTAIVTGASGAFGALAAKALAASGANVVIAASNADALKKIAAECGKLGGKLRRFGRSRDREVRRPRYPGGCFGPEQGLENRRPKGRGLP